MVQTRTVAALLAQRGVATTLLGLTTAGDRDTQTPIEQLGEVNVFVKELENALRDRRADYAVHSCKDLAGSLPDDMRIAAISRREDPRDAFCSERYQNFEALPPGAIVGTSSNRRRAALSALRSDLRYVAVRGNIDTRLRKLGGEYDAIVLAMAGLLRLKVSARYVVPFSIDQIVPAVGQGALAVETRADDEWLLDLLHEAVNDPESELCVACERAALRAMRAGCSAPLGVHAHFAAGGTLVVEGTYSQAPGVTRRARIDRYCPTLQEAEALGAEVAEGLKGSDATASWGAGS